MRTLQGLLENNNAPASASGVVNNRSRQPDDNPQLDFTGSSLRQMLLVQGGTAVPNDFLPEIDSDEWEGLEPDPFDSDTPPLSENSMNDQEPHKQQQKDVDDDGDQGGGNNNLFLGLAAVGAAALGAAAVALVGQNKNNDTKNDNRQAAQRSRS